MPLPALPGPFAGGLLPPQPTALPCIADMGAAFGMMVDAAAEPAADTLPPAAPPPATCAPPSPVPSSPDVKAPNAKTPIGTEPTPPVVATPPTAPMPEPWAEPEPVATTTSKVAEAVIRPGSKAVAKAAASAEGDPSPAPTEPPAPRIDAALVPPAAPPPVKPGHMPAVAPPDPPSPAPPRASTMSAKGSTRTEPIDPPVAGPAPEAPADPQAAEDSDTPAGSGEQRPRGEAPAPQRAEAATPPTEAGLPQATMPFAAHLRHATDRPTLPADAAPVPATARTATPAPHDVAVLHHPSSPANSSEAVTIRMAPAHLGRIEVRLDFGETRQLSAEVIADRPQTLEALRRDADQLHRSLTDAGFTGAGLDLKFGAGAQGGDSAFTRDSAPRPRFARVDDDPATTTAIDTTDQPVRLALSGRVDLLA